ncbi:MAG TPA: choice-of-anchor tandem repeat GloVer-containing protein, partial [Candidatus Cybelea sp.]
MGCGTVFSISAAGKETVLYAFKGGSADGEFPSASLLKVNGKLYGTTSGGYNREGTVFAITTSGKETSLYSFKGAPDGAQPSAPLLNVKGTLYGTTAKGGSGCSSGCGTVFSITKSGKETVLHSFGEANEDGRYPLAGLIDVGGMVGEGDESLEY